MLQYVCGTEIHNRFHTLLHLLHTVVALTWNLPAGKHFISLSLSPHIQEIPLQLSSKLKRLCKIAQNDTNLLVRWQWAPPSLMPSNVISVTCVKRFGQEIKVTAFCTLPITVLSTTGYLSGILNTCCKAHTYSCFKDTSSSNVPSCILAIEFRLNTLKYEETMNLMSISLTLAFHLYLMVFHTTFL